MTPNSASTNSGRAIPRRDDSIQTTYFDKYTVPDPYRWMEDPDDPETASYVKQESEHALKALGNYENKSKIYDAVKDLMSMYSFSAPRKLKTGYYYWMYNPGNLNQSQIYRSRELITKDDASQELFFDPNTLSKDGTIALAASSFSKTGKFWAYALSEAGSDRQTLYVKNIEGKVNDKYLEKIEDVFTFGIAWMHDDSGFFYSRFPKKAGNELIGKREYHQVYYHQLGTESKDDIVVMENNCEPNDVFDIMMSHDGEYLLMKERQGTASECKVFYVKVNEQITNGKPNNSKLQVGTLVPNMDSSYDYVTNEGTKFYFVTNNNASKRRVIAIDTISSIKTMEEVVAESVDQILEGARCFGKRYIALDYLKMAASKLNIFDLITGETRELDLPVASLSGITGGYEETEIFFTITSFNTPCTIYRFDASENGVQSELRLFRNQTTDKFDPEEFVTKQVNYESKDGTKVSMFIFHHKDVTPNENTPTLLYGYGGFEISLGPMFSPFIANFAKLFKGIFAMPSIRGGGEFGADWHEAGKLLKKQNCFDDFQSAAKYLISSNYTSAQKLAINGGSNGGLLVGACCNQAPSLFKAAVAEVGVLDMLRFNKFTVGPLWMCEYGDPDTNLDQFLYLKNYSPLHNIQKDVNYPAILLMTGDHDDRVVPAHSLKLFAELNHQQQDKSEKEKQFLLRVDINAGHGAGKPKSKKIEEITDKLVFLSKSLDIPLNES